MLPPIIAKVPTRIATRMGVTYCTLCNLAIIYCRCSERSADAPSADAVASASLDKRIRDAKAAKP